MEREIKYQALWGRLYFAFGIIFGLIFILGAIILDDYSILFNLLLCVMMFIIGKAMTKKPYAVYNSKEIIQYSFFGNIRKHYSFNKPDEIEIRNNHFYLNNKKLKMNNWFVDKRDWERAKQFYSGESDLLDELID